MKLNRRHFATAGGAALLAAASRQSRAAAERSTAGGKAGGVVPGGGTAAVGGMAAAGGTVSAGGAALEWSGYSNTLAVDAMGGLGGLTDDGTLTAAELADARNARMAAVRLSLAPEGAFWFNDAAYHTTLRRISEWDRNLIAHPDVFMQIRAGADFMRAHREGRLGVIYGFQETSPIGEDLDRIDVFYKAGVRVIQLTHNRRNLVGDGSLEPGNAGLSNLGHEIVAGLNSKRIVVDLAHGAPRTIREGILASKAPVIISHTGCAAISDHPRCVSDESLRLMADRGGVAGIIFWPYLRKEGQPMAADVIRHIEHVIHLCGEDHVGIGTDCSISPVPTTAEFEKTNREVVDDLFEQGIFEKGRSHDLHLYIPDLNDVRRYEMLGAMLSARGHPDERIKKILGGNFVRVMSEVWGNGSAT